MIPWPAGVVHTEPIPDELQVHNLEDGGVLIQYRCDEPCPELVEQLTAAGQPYLSSPYPYVILAPYPEMETRIALTAWGRIDQFEEFDEARIRALHRDVPLHELARGAIAGPGARPELLKIVKVWLAIGAAGVSGVDSWRRRCDT